MKRMWALATVAAMIFSAGLYADDKDGKRPPGKGEKDERWEEIVKKFDKDGDGQLNDEEKAAAKAAMGERHGGKGHPEHEAMVKKFDKNGDGQLDADEKAAAKAQMEKHHEAEQLKRFDRNHDGKLDDKEREQMEKMKEEWKKRDEKRKDRRDKKEK